MAEAKTHKLTRTQAVLALLILSVVIVGAIIAAPSKSKTGMVDAAKTSTASQTTGSSSTMAGSSTMSSTASAYKDGSYKATGQYYSPGGKESIGVSLTLKNDIVVASSLQVGANDPTATTYQSIFMTGYMKQVIGKKISSIHLTNVSGSSLTSQGFNNALKQIEHQAEA
jgi:uncharacterized protein with FMN-binding domain